jgi:hypothetical protein
MQLLLTELFAMVVPEPPSRPKPPKLPFPVAALVLI